MSRYLEGVGGRSMVNKEDKSIAQRIVCPPHIKLSPLPGLKAQCATDHRFYQIMWCCTKAQVPWCWWDRISEWWYSVISWVRKCRFWGHRKISSLPTCPPFLWTSIKGRRERNRLTSMWDGAQIQRKSMTLRTNLRTSFVIIPWLLVLRIHIRVADATAWRSFFFCLLVGWFCSGLHLRLPIYLIFLVYGSY